MATKPHVTSFTPQLFSVSSDTTFVLTGVNLNTPYLWVQIRDIASSSTDSKISFVATSQAATTATFTISARAIQATGQAYQVWWGASTSATVPPASTAWASNANLPKVLLYDLSSGIGNTVPCQGGTNCVVGLYNAPDGATANVTYTPKSTRQTSWNGTSGAPAPVSVSGWIQITNTITKTGLVHFASPLLPFEGQYDLGVSLTVSSNSSPVSSVSGPGAIGYVPILGSYTDVAKPSVCAMTIPVSFTATPPAPNSQWNQGLPDTTNEANYPSWVGDFDNNPKSAGAGDTFDWSGNGLSVYGVNHALIDESGITTQLLELEGTGMLVNGSPVALRVWVDGKGWRCARMDTTATTYTQAGNYPNQWVVDDSSQEYPSRPEEIFGIYQLVKNPNYQIGNDAANQAARAAPCLIETSNPNEIMIGIDKIILVPTAFTRPVDPYFVNPASLPSVNLVSFARPPQSLVYNDGGFIDGIKVDATLYMVYMTGYITYTVPSDAVASATLGAPPNPAEDISCTCLGSAPLTISTAPTVKYTLVVASEPATTARPSNLFYTIYQGQGGGIPPFASSWKPLMSVSTAQAIANGNGQVSIVQVSDTSVLLFQRSRSEILQVYVCTLDINNTNLTLSDPAGAIANGILSLKDATVMPSVLQAYSTRFGLQFPDGADYNLIYDTWFSVLYQPSNGAFSSPGYHIFASPYTFTSTIIHLWYPATTAAPFIDETKGTCVGVYGTVPLSIPPTNPPSTTPPSMHIITGNLGSKLDFVVDSVTYGGSDPVYLEVKVNQASMTYSVREWGKYASGFVAPSGSLAAVSTDVRNVHITLSDGSNCTLNLHWTGTTVAGVAGTVNPSTVVDGDFWIFEVQPYSIANMTSGTLNNGTGVLALDVSQSHLPRDSSFSCSFTLTYIAPATPGGFGALTVANSKNASGDQSAKNLIIPNGTSPLNASSQITLSPSTANIVVTLAATPADQDSWSITITNGDVSNPVSGIPNTGDWAYPTVSGSYTGATQSRVSVACYKIDNVNNSPATLHFTYNEDGGIDKDFTLSVQTKTNSDGTQVITGWSTATLDNGLTFGFDNLSGTPATTDHWAFDVTPSVALLEVIGQRPVAMFTSSAQNPQSAWLVAPTKSAGGRILQLQVPLQPPTAGKSNVPNPAIAGLLPLRTTLEPYLGLVGGVPTLSFKGLKTSGVSWSAAIQKEVPTDSTNQLAYGLLGYLKEDYRPSHSGPYYTTALGSQGITDSSTINMWSTFAVSDVLAEPHLPSDFASELPTPGWTADPLSTTPPQYRPTAWMALFPQYRFHIGQVHVASDLSLNFSLDPSATASALKTRILTGSGRQVLYEDFFANNMIPAVNPDVYSQWKSAVSEGLSVDSRKQWLQDGSGNSINPFTNNDFLQVSWDPTWTTDADYPKVAKYILQLSVLRQLWDSPPGWTVNTDEGRNVPNYWKFRIGGPVADQFLNTAFASPAYMNKRTTLQNQLLPQYFSTNPLFPAAFGSAAAAFAAVLTDPRMEPSFNQLTDRARTKLINAMVQQVSTSGLALNRTVLSYLANRSIVQNPSPINSNIVSEIPITVTPKSDGSLPATWELNLARFAGPLMQFSMLLQGTLGLILPNAEGVDLGIKNIGAEIASIIQRQQAIGAPGDRPVVEPRPATRPVTVELEEAVQPSGTNVAQEASIRSAEYNLTPELKKALGEVRTNLKVTGVDTAFTGLMAAAMIAGTVASWEANDQEGAIGIAKNVVSVIGDAVAAVQFGTKIAETYLRFQQIKSLESGSVEMVEEAAKIKDTLKSLEKFSKFLSGALNVAFGVLNILSGTQELEKGGSQKLNGQLDVASGAFLVAGGAVELASLTTLGAGLAETGIGELIAGIGMEISIVKIWVGGRASIGAFGESLAEFFGADAGLSQEDQTINYIINVKQVAVYSQVSRKATKSPDPRDGGAESNRYLIEPPYSVADVADS